MHIYKVKRTYIKAWTIFFLASLFCAYEFAIRVMIGPITQNLLRDFSLTAKGIGALSSAFFYGYAPVQLISGYFYSLYGAKRVLISALFLCALALFFFSYSYNFYFSTLLRFITGVGGGFAFIGAYILIANWFPIRWWALLYGLIQLMSCFGAIHGQYIFASYTQTFHWRDITFYISLLGFFILALFILYLKDSPRGQRRIKQPQKLLKQIQRVLSNPQSCCIASYALLTWGPVAIFATLWGASFLTAKFHLSNQAATLLISATWLGVGLGSPFIGLCGSGVKNRKNLLLLCAFIGLVATSILIYMPAIPLKLLYLLLFALGFGTAAQPISFVLIQEANEKTLRSVAIGINNTAVIIGGALLQPLSSILINYAQYFHGGKYLSVEDYRSGLLLMPLCYLLTIFITYFFINENKEVPFSEEIKDGGFA